MTAPRLTSAVSDRTDIKLAAIFGRVRRAWGHQTRIRSRGPDVYVDAVGKTPEGAKRETRIWITSAGTVAADKTSAFVRRCERADIEPHVAAVGDDRVAPDVRRPGLVVLDALAIAVEICETGVELFIRDLAAEGDGASDDEGGGLGSEDGDDDAEDPEDDGVDKSDTADRPVRREVLTKAGTYVAGGLVTYLVVERVSGVVQQSPEPRAAVVRRVAWLDTRLPDTRLLPVEWPVPAPQPLPKESTLPNRTTAVSTSANATAIPYTDLRERPETYTGTTVTYTGRVEETMERDEVRLALIAAEDGRGRLSGDVVARWPTGRLPDDDIGFRLLADECIRLWGVVASEGSISGGVRYLRIDVSVLEKTWASRLRGGWNWW